MTEEASTEQKVKRVNTEYVSAQDRFRLAAEMADGEVQALWLTQRLLRLTLTPIAGYFAKTKPPSDEQRARRSYTELINKVKGKGGPPVASLPVASEWLVESIGLKFGPPVRFTFRGPNGEQAFMEMDSLKLRKWLGMLHRKAIKAGWPLDLWPEGVVDQLE